LWARLRDRPRNTRRDGPGGFGIGQTNVADVPTLLHRHLRHDRNSHSRSHQTQQAAELATLENDLWIEPSPVARTHQLQIQHFYKADPAYGGGVVKGLGIDVKALVEEPVGAGD
jgi:hypothetical protein